MAELYGRFSIGAGSIQTLWTSRTRTTTLMIVKEMIAEARRLLQAGRFKSIVLYELDPTKNDYVEIEELTQGDL